MQLGNFFLESNGNFVYHRDFASGFWPPTSYVAM